MPNSHIALLGICVDYEGSIDVAIERAVERVIKSVHKLLSGHLGRWRGHRWSLRHRLYQVQLIVHGSLKRLLHAQMVLMMMHLLLVRVGMRHSVAQLLPEPWIAPLDVGVRLQVGLHLDAQTVGLDFFNVAAHDDNDTGTVLAERLLVGNTELHFAPVGLDEVLGQHDDGATGRLDGLGNLR